MCLIRIDAPLKPYAEKPLATLSTTNAIIPNVSAPNHFLTTCDAMITCMPMSFRQRWYSHMVVGVSILEPLFVTEYQYHWHLSHVYHP